MEWKSIDTAPKDGSCVLVAVKPNPHANRSKTYDGWSYYVAYFKNETWKYSGKSILLASHWMPLPPPPVEA